MILEITIPANTTELNPFRVQAELFNAAVRDIVVNIPDGHKYLARLKIETRGVRLAPDLNSAPYIRGNNNQVAFSINKKLEGPPYPLTLIGWNEDDTYSHTFFVEVR